MIYYLISGGTSTGVYYTSHLTQPPHPPAKRQFLEISVNQIFAAVDRRIRCHFLHIGRQVEHFSSDISMSTADE